MVKHGTAKKRRGGLKITRKPPQNRQLKIIKSIANSDIKASYDKKKSPKENLIEFGLVPDANNINNVPNIKKKKDHAAFVGYANIVTDSNSYSEKNPKRKVLSDFDKEYAKKNIDKHGDNYKAMELDHHTNDRQLTAKKLETLCQKYSSVNE